MLTVFDPAYHRSERTALGGQTFGSVRIAQKDQKSIRINPTRSARLREPFEVLHIDRLHDQCSWNAPAFTPAFRHIPSLRCQENRARILAGGIGALGMDAICRDLVEPAGIEPATSSLQS